MTKAAGRARVESEKNERRRLALLAEKKDLVERKLMSLTGNITQEIQNARDNWIQQNPGVSFPWEKFSCG